MELGRVFNKVQTPVNFFGSKARSAWLTEMAAKPMDQVTLRMLKEHTLRKAHDILL